MHTDLGPLAPLAASADEWRSRATIGGMTWAGLWRTEHRADVMALVQQHTQKLGPADFRQLTLLGQLPGVRSFTHLIALLPAESPNEKGSCDSITTREEELEPPPGIPIFDHGEFAQARLSEIRHAVHLTRYLDDYHEPTLAALRRRLVRGAGDDEEGRRAAARQAADRFLERPTRWRDVVELAVFLSTVRALEATLGSRLTGPGRTTGEIHDKVSAGVAALVMSGSAGSVAAARITALHDERLSRLAAATVVLLYEEHRYLHLLGVSDGRSTRRHLPRGLHLVFSDQQHRREDRTAGLWLAESGEQDQAGPYHFAAEIPPAYAARKRRDGFRLADEAAVRRYTARLSTK